MLKLGIEAEKDLKARESTYLLLDLVCKVIFLVVSMSCSDCVFYSLAQLVCDSSESLCFDFCYIVVFPFIFVLRSSKTVRTLQWTC